MPKLISLTTKILKQIASEYDLPDVGTKASFVALISEETGSDEIDPSILKSILQKDNVDMQMQVENLTALMEKMAEKINELTNSQANNAHCSSDTVNDVGAESQTNSDERRYSSANGSPVRSELCVNANTRGLGPNNERTIESKMNIQDISKTLPDFDPINGNLSAQQFIDKITGMTNIYNWSKDAVLFAAQSKLLGHAKMWLDAQPVFETLHEFSYALLRDFPHLRSTADIHIEMVNRNQLRNETVVEYFYTMLSLGRKGQLDDRSIIQHTINGLHDEQLKQMLRTMMIKTSTELFAALKENVHRAPVKEKYDKPPVQPVAPRKLATEYTESKKIITCYNCGKSGHISMKCPDPQKKPRCQLCKKTNHSIENCPNDKPNVHEVDDNGQTKLKKQILVNGIEVTGFVDPGSGRTLIKKALAYMLAETTACQISLKGFTEQVNIVLKIDDSTLNINMLVVDNNLLAEDVLIGRDVLCQQGQRLIIENGDCHIQEITEVNNVETIKDPQLNSLLEQFQDVFANQVSELGKCNKVKMKIELTSETPIQLKPYRIPFAKRITINQILNELLEHQIIRPSSSDYASPTVLVTKKNGEPRLCVDYRMLNKITKKIPFPMPLIDEQFAQLAGNMLYSTLDLKMGYHQIEICEESKKFTAFITNDGHFEYNRMPFGLVNAPGVFQALMNQLSSRMPPGALLTYLDDVIIPSKSKEEGLERLEKVFLLLREFGLTLRKDKCQFLVNEIQHLGHKIKEQNISPGECKVAAIREFKTPTNQTEVRRFLGLTGFFRKFVSQYALISSPLTQLLKKDAKLFEWKEEQQFAFSTLIEKLTQAPTLQLYNVNAKHEVHTDACSTGLAGVLLQSVDGKKWNAVCYYSRRCTECESISHSYELEVLAVVETLERFRIYLLGKNFTIVTDCAAIATMKQQKELKPKVARWWLKLLEYDFNIIHRNGPKLAHVDAMSRAPVEDAVEVTEAGFIYEISERNDDWLFLLQMKDDTLKEIYDVLAGKTNNPKTKQIKTDYDIYEYRIYRKTPEGNKFVVPKAIRWRVIESSHDRMGHPSLNKTIERIRKTFWFPKMTKCVKEYISACTECCYSKSRGGKSEGELHLVELDPIPFASIHIDHLGPFIRSKRGNTYIIAISDAFTKYLIVKAVKSTKTAPVITVLNDLTTYFGLPCKITTDRGTAYTSKQFEEYCKNNFIRHIKNAVKTPRANGQVERANRMILEYLRSTVTNPKDWDSYLRELQWTINTQKNSTTGYTPNQLLFDFNPRDIITNAIIASLGNQNVTDNIPITLRRQEALENIKSARENWKKIFDKKHAKPTLYQEKDLVVIHNEPPSTGESRKLEPKFKGPYQITRILGNDRYLVESIPGTSHHQRKFCSVFATDKLKPWCSEVPDMIDTNDNDNESTFEDEVLGQEGPNCNSTA